MDARELHRLLEIALPDRLGRRGQVGAVGERGAVPPSIAAELASS